MGYVESASCKWPYLILFFVSIIVGCTQKSNPLEPDQVVKEVTEMLHEYHGAIEEGGLKAEFDYLDSTDEFFWIPPGYQAALDYDSVEAVLRARDPNEGIELHWDTLKVTPLRNDLAQFYGTISMATTDTAGNVTNGNLVETGLVVKRSDGWKLLSGQSAFFSF